MTLLETYSFDDNTYTSYLNGGYARSTSYGRHGSNGVRTGDWYAHTGYIIVPQVTYPDEFIWAVAMRVNSQATSGGTDGESFHIGNTVDGGDGETEQSIAVWRTPAGATYVRGPFGTSSSTAAGTWPGDAWVYLEVKCVVGNSPNGSYDVRLNGTSIHSASSVDTQRSVGYINRIMLPGQANIHNAQTYWDDIYICDDNGTTNNDFLGDVIVENLKPDADGEYSEMTGSDGNQIDNWDLVSDASSATYNGSGVEGTRDSYNIETLSSTSLTPLGVVQKSWYGKSAAGTKYMRPLVRTGSTGGGSFDTVGDEISLSIGNAYYAQVHETNPYTTNPWTEGEITDNLEIGQEVRDST